MGSKSNPGKFDCWSRAEPDEPVFVLLGRDPVASIIVADWAALRERLGQTEPEVLEEAQQCAERMAQWAVAKGKSAQLEAANEARSLTVREHREVGAQRERRKIQEAVEKLFPKQDFANRVFPLRDENKPQEQQEPLETTQSSPYRALHDAQVRIRELEALCKRAADLFAQTSANLKEDGYRGLKELDDVVKELRGA
jgi:hypothetical protein